VPRGNWRLKRSHLAAGADELSCRAETDFTSPRCPIGQARRCVLLSRAPLPCQWPPRVRRQTQRSFPRRWGAPEPLWNPGRFTAVAPRLRVRRVRLAPSALGSTTPTPGVLVPRATQSGDGVRWAWRR